MMTHTSILTCSRLLVKDWDRKVIFFLSPFMFLLRTVIVKIRMASFGLPGWVI
ncbi:hypothetical protein HanIR_Chr02g0081231 [Helianthus annuus]|nr:hypothetical protein HanIR_Chr02g0081231 [Helianthus annuus]